MAEVPALHAEVDGAQLALVSARVEEVVEKLVASGAGVVLTLETVGLVAWLEELVAEDGDNTFSSSEEVLAVGAELESVAGVVESLQGVQGGVGARHAEDVGVSVSGHCHQLLLCVHLRISHCLLGQQLSPGRRQFEGVVAELVHFHQSVSMGDQQMPVVMGEFDSPPDGGLEVQSLQGGEGVIHILVDQHIVPFFIADGQVLVVVGEGDRSNGMNEQF